MEKMVFIGGPRQVGKTTLAKHLLMETGKMGRYLNWDYAPDQLDILEMKWSENDRLLIFDELHKYRKWKNWVKGLYDVIGEKHSILITGSARLDVYKRGGDSLLGRYHYWRLHPYTIDDFPQEISPQEAFKRLMTIGGFPEPFLKGNTRTARRWRLERFRRILQEDIRDLESVHDIQAMGLLVNLLRERVAQRLTYDKLAAKIHVAPNTVKKWIELLERMYLTFIVRPWQGSLTKGIRKQPKIYFFDNGDVNDEPGVCFENLIATTLLKRLHFYEDSEGVPCELRYVADASKREVDFAIIIDGSLHELIEVKYSDENISTSLKYFKKRLHPQKTTQIVANLKRPYDKDGIQVIDPFSYFNKILWGAELEYASNKLFCRIKPKNIFNNR